MFNHELSPVAKIIGVDKGADFGALLKRDWPDFIWLATRNPVSEPVKSYYSFLKGKENIPTLILSQNGLSAVDDAQVALKEVLGQAAEKVRIIRISLCNQVEIDETNKELGIKYKLPIMLGFGPSTSSGQTLSTRASTELSRRFSKQVVDDVEQIFKAAGFKTQKFFGKGVRDMEYSKLFSNLIGMAAAVNGKTVNEGLRDKTIFIQEIMMLKELAAVAKAEHVSFTDLGNYPVRFGAFIIKLPIWLLLMSRGLLVALVEKKRAGKPKDLSEIDYYNGEVVKLGKKFGIPTPINEKIVEEAKRIEIR